MSIGARTSINVSHGININTGNMYVQGVPELVKPDYFIYIDILSSAINNGVTNELEKTNNSEIASYERWRRIRFEGGHRNIVARLISSSDPLRKQSALRNL